MSISNGARVVDKTAYQQHDQVNGYQLKAYLNKNCKQTNSVRVMADTNQRRSGVANVTSASRMIPAGARSGELTATFTPSSLVKPAPI